MKIRWTRDSIRLRITPSELAMITRGDTVRESIGFPGGLFWNITLGPGPAETTLTSDQQGAFLSLSAADRDRLAEPDVEGVYFQANGPQPIRYFVEKDFPCVHPRASEALESAAETFDEPDDFRRRKNEGNSHGE